MEEEPAVFVGVDWASEEHDACAIDVNGKVLGERRFKHGGTGLAELAGWLAKIGAGESRVAVAIEVPRGPIVETLLERGFRVFSINPKQMDRFRDRFTVAGAKDDRFDARVLADSLRTDRPCFRPLRIDDPLVIELREWSRMADDLQQERTRLSNRVREQLWRYFPQMLDLTDDVSVDWFLDLWMVVQTPARAKQLKTKVVERVLQQHRVRRVDATTVLTKLKERPLVVAPGTIEAAAAHVALAAQRLKLVNAQLRTTHKQLEQLCERMADEGQKGEQRDVAILQSLPGVGRIVLATLLAEASEPLRNRDYHALRTLCGAAPVTRRSGKSHVVSMRQACAGRLRSAVYHWARVASQHDLKTGDQYASLRARGHSHGRALRSIADRLLELACAMLRNGTTYDPSRRRALQPLQKSAPSTRNLPRKNGQSKPIPTPFARQGSGQPRVTARG